MGLSVGKVHSRSEHFGEPVEHGGTDERPADPFVLGELRLTEGTLAHAVLDTLSEALAPGTDLADAEAEFGEYDLDDSSAVLSALGYRVEWEGLSGGVLREKD